MGLLYGSPTRLCSVKQRVLPSISTRIKSLATTVNDQQCALRGIQDEEQNEALCALENQEKVYVHLSKNFKSRFLNLPISEEALK